MLVYLFVLHMAVRERERFGMPGTTLTRKDSVSQLDERKALIKSWYKGTLLAPSPENGDHALFNAPVFVASISNKQRFFFISRVMNHRQQASVTDRSTHFY